MYSWQKNQWQHIMQQRVSLPHALLLRGRAGTGKQEFALDLSKTLLCSQVGDQACGVCPSCVWFAEGNHPDFRLITPEDADNAEDAPVKKKATKKSQISVAQIRQLIDYLSLSSHQVKSERVILISPADTLNLASANALLKMLDTARTRTRPRIFIVCSVAILAGSPGGRRCGPRNTRRLRRKAPARCGQAACRG